MDTFLESKQPEFLIIKGSSVTGVSYATKKNQKRFHDGSDYDCALSWLMGLYASQLLSQFLAITRDLLDQLSLTDEQLAPGIRRQLTNSIGRTDPSKDPYGGENRLILHNTDKLYERARNGLENPVPDIPAYKVSHTPDGKDHYLFCQHLQHKCMQSKHDINFVINDHPSSLQGHLYPVNLLDYSPTTIEKISQSSPVTDAVETVHKVAATQSAVVQSYFSECYSHKDNLLRHKLKQERIAPTPPEGGFLVYSWGLVEDAAKRYQNNELKGEPDSEIDNPLLEVDPNSVKVGGSSKKSSSKLKRLKRKMLEQVTHDAEAGVAATAGVTAKKTSLLEQSQDRLFNWINKNITDILQVVLTEIENAKSYVKATNDQLMKLLTEIHQRQESGDLNQDKLKAHIQQKSNELLIDAPKLLTERRLEHLSVYATKVWEMQTNEKIDTPIIQLIKKIEIKVDQLLKLPSYESYFYLKNKLSGYLKQADSPVSVTSFFATHTCDSPAPKAGRSRSRLSSSSDSGNPTPRTPTS